MQHSHTLTSLRAKLRFTGLGRLETSPTSDIVKSRTDVDTNLSPGSRGRKSASSAKAANEVTLSSIPKLDERSLGNENDAAGKVGSKLSELMFPKSFGCLDLSVIANVCLSISMGSSTIKLCVKLNNVLCSLYIYIYIYIYRWKVVTEDPQTMQR